VNTTKCSAITVRIVEAHIARTLGKLDLKSRAQIAAWKVAKGLHTHEAEIVRSRSAELCGFPR
jgi:hypothetical protein